MCGEKKIFSQDSLRHSQLVAVVNTSTQMDPLGPHPKDPEIEEALEHSPSLSSYREVIEGHTHVKQLCAEARKEGLQTD